MHYVYIYIHMYMCVCVCVCGCVMILIIIDDISYIRYHLSGHIWCRARTITKAPKSCSDVWPHATAPGSCGASFANGPARTSKVWNWST